MTKKTFLAFFGTGLVLVLSGVSSLILIDNVHSFSADSNTNSIALLSNVERSVSLNNYNNWHFQYKPTDQSFDSKIANISKRQEINYTESWDQSGVTVAKLKTLNPDLKVYRTYVLNVKPTWDSDWNNASDLGRLQFPITRAMINDPNNVRGGAFDQNATDDWWLRDGAGNIIKESNSQWFVDVGDPRYKEIFLQTILNRNAGKNFDGILFDYWWPTMISSWMTYKGLPVSTKYPNDAAWYENAWKPFITYVMDGLHRAGYKIIGNCAGSYNSGNYMQDYQRSLLDGTVYEQGSIDWPDQGSNWLKGSVIEKRLASISADPLDTWIGTFGLRFTDSLFAQKNQEDLAFYYISLPQDSNLRAKRSYHYYGDAGIFWDKLWDLNIGTPQEERVKTAGKYAWSRKFTEGLVLLNYGDTVSSTENITFDLDRRYLDINGVSYSGTVTLPAHTGLILKAVASSNTSSNSTPSQTENSTSALVVTQSSNNSTNAGSSSRTDDNSVSDTTDSNAIDETHQDGLVNPSNEDGANLTTAASSTAAKVRKNKTSWERLKSAVSSLGPNNKAVTASITAIIAGLLLIIIATIQYLKAKKIDDNFISG